jgi:dienelactone hydrolase
MRTAIAGSIVLHFLFIQIAMSQPKNYIVPEFQIPKTLTQWQEQRKDVRQSLVKLLGNIPEVTTPAVKIISTEHKDRYVIQKFEFDNGAGAIVPGVLLIPDNGKEKHPAIFYCHWHGGNYDLGKQEIFTTHHTPEIPSERFIEEGYVVIAIDAYCFGERSGKGPGGPTESGAAEETSSSKKELWLGRSLWAMMIRDDMMALNYLFTRGDVDVKNVAVTGISMGATRSWWLMALDERIKTGVAVACLTRYQNLMDEQKLKYHGIYYYVPGILNYFDTEAIVSLIAPRPVLFMTGDQDMGSPVTGIMKIETDVKKFYALYRSDKSFKNIVYPDVGHEYTKTMWENMIEWMRSNLN